MKRIKGLCRKLIVVFLMVTILISSISLGSTYATTIKELPEGDSMYRVEILSSDKNTYQGDSDAGFTVNVYYSGEGVIQKEALFLETVVSDSKVASKNEEILSENRYNLDELTRDIPWEETYSLYLPEIDTDVDYMVMLKDGTGSVLASANYQFTVHQLQTETLQTTEETPLPEIDKRLEIYKLREYTDITGTLPHNITGLDKLYYGSVADDITAPFHDAEGLRNILENEDEAYAKAVWQKYRYDLYDPNFEDRGGSGALLTPSGGKYSDKKPPINPEDRPDYADELLESTGHEYPKDGNSPFHANIPSQIDSVQDATLVNGALVENDEDAFENLKKTASPDIGDRNINREYTVDLKATPNLKQVKPTVLLFQIQTSWQMFDLLHANDRASLVKGNEVTADLLSLYEMKQGFLDFMDWMKQYTDGSLMIGITNYQHNGSNSMFGVPYFTNNAGHIMEGLYGWDSFGDCEHIHYSSKALENAMKELGNSYNFVNWVDKRNASIYEDAEMISVIVGGACEADDLKGNKSQLPDITKKEFDAIQRQYGIRTNSGTTYGKTELEDKISWMDVEEGAGAFDTGAYHKNVVTREEFFETLKAIYADVQSKAPNMQEVTNVNIEDVITAEFEVKVEEIRAFVGGKDITEKAEITVEKQTDGTTKVVCNFGTVKHNKEVHLQIPVQAKNDFIGSNNVKTNTGTPTICYTGRVDEGRTFTQSFIDKPAVNVPIRFEVDNGRNISISPGQNIDLAELSKDVNKGNLITKAIEEALDKYAQIEGTITYQWVDSDGNKVGNATTSTIDSTNRTPPDIPSYTFNGKDEDLDKKFTYKLQVTFTPTDVKAETTSKIPVSELTKDGDVIIEIAQKQVGKIRIKKIIDNYNDYGSSLKSDEFMIQINSTSGTSVSTEVVLNHEETSAYIEITEATILNIEEILPMEYDFAGITVEGLGYESSDVTGSSIYVDRGDDITITVHNRYECKPFFHAFDSITNLFKRK